MQKNTTQHDLRLHSDDVINHLVSLHQRPKENALERRQNVNVMEIYEFVGQINTENVVG